MWHIIECNAYTHIHWPIHIKLIAIITITALDYMSLINIERREYMNNNLYEWKINGHSTDSVWINNTERTHTLTRSRFANGIMPLNNQQLKCTEMHSLSNYFVYIDEIGCDFLVGNFGTMFIIFNVKIDKYLFM